MTCSPKDLFLFPHSKEERRHPERVTLERFMRRSLPRADAQAVVRHLLAGCESCREITRRLWDLGAPSQPQAVAPERRLETPAAPALFPTLATRSSAFAEGSPMASSRTIVSRPSLPCAGRDQRLVVSRPAAPQPALSSPDWTDLLETLPESLREALVSILKGFFLFRRIRSARLSGRKGAPGR